ncbi:CapA family protein [Catellatospora tritici]|uniref:CapA family protein n=1 Tax=Catellatospora tritici TaxID=2851566 RepID=UPI0027DF48AC|nr:CapA family protein [Catellatospora tritici]
MTRPRLGRAARPLACLALLTALAACATEPQPASWHPPATAAEPSATASTAPAPAEEITLAFAGDVHFTGRTLALLKDPDNAFGPYAKQLRAADFAMVNMETPITDRGSEQPKEFHFRGPKEAYPAIKAAGIDLVSIANNHTLDYGQIGLLDTLDSAKEAGQPVVGAGHNTEEAYAPYLTTVKGVRLAIVGMSQVHDLKEQWKPTPTRPGIAMAFDKNLAVAAVQKARTQADVVIVFMHWGTEGQSCPNGEQKTFAKLMADNGADLVLGTHAHVLLSDGFIGDTYVHYGLGNFLWYSVSKSTDTGLLTVVIKNGKVKSRVFTPGVVSNNGQPVPVTGNALNAVRQRLDQASRCTGLAAQPRA